MREPSGVRRTASRGDMEISYAIAVRNHGNLSEITEIRKKSREIRKSSRHHETNTPFLSEHAHLRNPRENHARNQSHEAGNQQVRFGKSQKSGNLVRPKARVGPLVSCQGAQLSASPAGYHAFMPALNVFMPPANVFM